MWVVLDTDVLVAALRSDRGASRRLLLDVRDGRLHLLASVPLFVEYEEVLKRPAQLAAAGLSLREVDGFLDGLAALVEPVSFRFLWRPQLRDADDEMVLETAVNGRAEWLVTFNTRHFEEPAARFGVKVCRPGVIARILDEE